MALYQTKELYERIRSAWDKNHDPRDIAREAGVPIRTAERILTSGIPRLGLPPLQPHALRRRSQKGRRRAAQIGEGSKPSRTAFVQAALGLRATQEAEELEAAITIDIKTYEKQSAKLIEQIEKLRAQGVHENALTQLREAFSRTLVLEQALTTVKQEALAADQLKRSADEAAASRMSLRTAASVASIVAHLTEKILQGIEDGAIELPEKLDAKAIVMLARAADTSASAVERALAIERKRLGKPETIIGHEIGMMLERCSDDELDALITDGKAAPKLLQQSEIRIVEADGDEHGSEGSEG